MHAKYEVSISHGSKVMAKIIVDLGYSHLGWREFRGTYPGIDHAALIVTAKGFLLARAWVY